MADEETQDPALESTGGAGKKKKLIIIGVVIVVVLALLGAGVAYYFLMEDSDVEGQGNAPEAVVLDRPVYHELRPEFIITFDANNRQRYMQIQVTVVTRDPTIVDGLLTHDPLIRNALIMVFSAQDYLQLQTSEGKVKLKLEATQRIQELLLAETGRDGIETVLFTNMVLQ
jgi:flagellar FliL protein